MLEYERMRRSYERVTAPHTSSVSYTDDLYHFMQDCWHLKDWIKSDLNVAESVRKSIEGEFKHHESLLVVADLANAAKHLKRTVKDRLGAYLTSTNVTVHLGQNRPIDTDYVITLSDNTTRSAEQIVRDAADAWDDLLRKLGLLS